MKKLSFLLLAGALLAGCGNTTIKPDTAEETSTFSKATEQGKLALADADMEKALGSFELALEEEPDDATTKKYVRQLEKAVKVKQLLNDDEYDKAIKKAQEVLATDGLVKGVATQVEQLKDKAEAAQQSASSKQQTTQTTTQTAPSKTNMYATYYNTAESIARNYDAPVEAIDGTQMDTYDPMLNGYKASHAQWDKLLNDIYGTLKARLSASDFNALRNVQRQWIKDRDNNVSDAYNYPGDYAPEIAAASTEASYTRDRCYELLNLYQTTLQ
ncbi:lysozyme inhibitor LprI family protein [Kurthia massiliensis]|uniref:lysozyme inhibitor LprI family protein n=1 Tax=Kurthia massiliensis TaxID=1033739 RepID=UPI00028920F4|nr:lysozyme inhibitor LprI family protein [Kurthia massiliensis]